MNRFGMEGRVDITGYDEPGRRPASLTLAYLHYWDKGMRVPADLAARLIEEGHDVEEQSLHLWNSSTYETFARRQGPLPKGWKQVCSQYKGR